MKKTLLRLAIFLLFLGNQGYAQSLSWASTKTFGSITDDEVKDMVMDKNGNYYLTGSFSNTIDIDPGPGSTILVPVGNSDAFVAKYNSSGNLLWVNVYGSTFQDYGFRLCLDNTGNLYATGLCEGLVDLDAGPGTTTISAGQYLIKLSPTGSTLWIRSATMPWAGYGTYNAMWGNLVTDQQNIYMTGNGGGSGMDFNPGPGTSTVSVGAWVWKLDTAGNFKWAKSITGTAAYSTRPAGLAVDKLGNVAMAGVFELTEDLDPGVGQFTVNAIGGNDIFLVKLDVMGNFIAGTTFGSSGTDSPGSPNYNYPSYNSLLFGSQGELYFGGSAGGSMDVDPGAGVNLVSSGSFLLKLNPNLSSLNWKISGLDLARLYEDPSGSIFCLGGSSISRISKSGSILNTQSSGTSLRAACVNTLSEVWACGIFTGTTNLALSPVTATYAAVGGKDIFVSKFNYCGMAVNASTVQICGTNPATLTVNGLGNYLWQPGSVTGSTFVINPISNTVYTVTGSAGTCAITQTILANVNPIVTPTIVPSCSNTLVCLGASTSFTATGANTYTWSVPVLNGEQFSPIASAIYTVTGTNVLNGCKGTSTLAVSVSPLPSLSINSSTNIVCSAGTVTLTASGSSTYSWSTGAFTNSIVVSPTVNTNYSVRGSNSVGCVSAASVVTTVSVFAKPTVVVNSGSICVGRSFTINPSGASTYTFSSGTATVSPSSTTIYSVIGTSSVGCVSSNTALSSVLVNTVPIIAVSSGSICTGSIYTLLPSGANTYTYSSGSALVSPATTTNYSITGKSLQGCLASNTAVATVSVLSRPVLTVNSGSICVGSTFTLNGSGASTYTYSSGSNLVSPAVSTNYSVTGTGTNGCVSSNTAVAAVSVYTNPVVSVAGGTICNGNSFLLNPSGAVSYTYSSGAFFVSPSATTSYSIIGKNTAGCISILPGIATVTVFSRPLVAVSNGTICSGQNFTLTPSGAISYSYSSGSNFVNPSSTTVYSVVGTNAAGCVSSAAATPTVYVNPLPMLSVSSLSVCSGQSYTLNPSGAASYTYSSGSAIVSPSSATNYTITGSSAAGCLALSPVVASIGVYPLPLITVPSGSICQGNSFILNPTGAVSYTFSGGSAIVSPTATSTYSVQGTNAYGCVSSSPASAVITVYTLPTISVNSGSICSGRSFTLIPSGALTYTYSSGTNVVSPLTNSSYSVTGTSALGCVGVNTAVSSVTVNATPSISVNSGVICSGQSFTLIPGGASTYTYSSGTNVVSPLTNSSYSVTGTNVLGCVGSNTAVSSVNVNPTPIITVNSGVICSGKSFTMVPSGASTYTYSSGSSVVSPLTNTSYSVRGTSASGCVGSNTAVSSVTVNTTPSISVNSGVICSGKSFTMVPSGASTYTYSSGSSVVSPLTNTTYSVSGTSALGCVGSNTAVSTVTVNASPLVSISNGTLCKGSTYTLNPGGALSYTYSSGSALVSPSVSTTYSITGTNALGCVSSNTAVALLTVYQGPTLSVNSGSILNGQTFTMIASGAISYTYSSGAAQVSPSVSTNYSVNGSNALGCVSAIPAISSVTVMPHNRFIHVSTTGNDVGSIGLSTAPFEHIQNAINYAISGDTVLAHPGRYKENVLLSGKNIVLTSEYYVTNDTNTINATIVDGDSITNALILNNTNSVLNGFTIERGYSNLGAGLKVLACNSPTVRNCYIQRNYGYGDITAHGVHFNATNGVLEKCKIRYNYGRKHTVEIYGNSIFRNSSVYSNIAWESSNVVVYSSANLSNLLIVNNQGGGLMPWLAAQSATLTNLTIANNTGFGVLLQNTVAKISNSIIWGNNRSTVGGTINPNINVMIWQSAAPATSILYIDNCAVQGGSTAINTNSYCILNYGANNISSNPQFVSSTDYRLSNNSPAIGAGIASLTLQGTPITVPATDYFGNPRPSPSATNPDLGAIENPLGAGCAMFVLTNDTVICAGSPLALRITGASSNTWMPGNFNTASVSVNPMISTIYTVSSSNAVAGCAFIQQTVSVLVNAIPSVSVVGSNSVCSGKSLTLTAGGAANYTWQPGGSTLASFAMTPSSTQSYSLFGKNSFGCAGTMAVKTVSVINNPTIAVSGATLCSGNSWWLSPSGAATYTFSGGFAIVSPSVSTNYSITGTSSQGCVSSNTAIASITVYQTPSLSISSASICSGKSYTLNPSGAFTYTYSSGSAVVNPISTSNYTVVGKSTAGCSSSSVVATVSVNATPIISVLSGSVCAGQFFTLTPSGASTYSYSSGSNIVNPSSSAVYSVVGTSSAGCVSTSAATASILVNARPIISVSNASICAGKSHTFNPSGAVSYTYSSGTSVVSPIIASTYTINGMSAAGCSALSPATVSIGMYPSPLISVSGASLCSGNSFTLNPVGAISYTYSSGSAIVSPSTSTSYSISGSNAYGCVSSSPAVSTITVYALPIISVNSGTICSGQSFTLNPIGANTYTYSSGSAIVSPLSTTNYSVTGTSAQGCIAGAAALSNVLVNATPTISVNSGSICSGSSFTLNPSGANTYTYSSGSAIVSPLSTSNYSVTGTSAQGCIGLNTAQANVIVNVIPTISVNSGTICSGQSFTLNPSGANTYTYSSGSAIVNPVASVNYSVSGTSVQGCVSSAFGLSSITVYTLPSISVNSGSICSGQSFTLIPSGASTYTYSSGSAVVSPNASSNYSITGTDAQGCVAASAAISSITVYASPTLAVNSGSICSGSSFTLNPSGANTYTYSSGSAIVSPMSTTNYSVTGTSAQGCVATNTAQSTVVVDASPTISVNSDSICSGDSFTILPIGANTYTYSSGSNVVVPSISSSYTVSGTGLNGCKSINSAISSITVIALPNINISGYSDICKGESTKLKASGAQSYTWNTGINTTTLVVQPTITSNYTVVGVNQFNCSNSQTIQISVSACTQIKNSDELSSMRLYPNPNNGRFTLEVPEFAQTTVSIYNYLGQTIFEGEAEERMSLDLSAFDKGLYTLVVINKNTIKRTFKVVKQ